MSCPFWSTTRIPLAFLISGSRWLSSVTRSRSAPVLCFYAEILAALPGEAEKVGVLEAAHGLHPIWRINRHGVDIAVFHPGVGAPLAAGFLEEAIVMGARKVVACGGCGTLSADVGAGDIVIPTSAVRDEGTSFHYLPPSRVVDADAEGVTAAIALLEERDVPFLTGKVWTTDAIYRETRQKVDRRRAEGCLVVEMEAAAFFAVARFRVDPLRAAALWRRRLERIRVELSRLDCLAIPGPNVRSSSRAGSEALTGRRPVRADLRDRYCSLGSGDDDSMRHTERLGVRLSDIGGAEPGAAHRERRLDGLPNVRRPRSVA